MPRPAPAGFRRSRSRRLRLFFRNSGIRARKAALATRLAHLSAALANPEPHLAYFSRRLLKGLRTGRLVPTAPAAQALAGDAASAQPIDDSS
jgi:hypothetical protein